MGISIVGDANEHFINIVAVLILRVLEVRRGFEGQRPIGGNAKEACIGSPIQVKRMRLPNVGISCGKGIHRSRVLGDVVSMRLASDDFRWFIDVENRDQNRYGVG